MGRFIVIAIIAGIGLIASFFTVSSKDVLSYNDRMVELAQSVDQVFVGIGAAIAPYQAGETVDIANLTAEIEKAQTSIDGQVSLIQALKVPEDPLCVTFHEHVLLYTGNSKAIAAIYRDAILPYITEHNPGTEDDVAALDELFGSTLAEDERLLAQVQASQAAMAQKHKIKLK